MIFFFFLRHKVLWPADAVRITNWAQLPERLESTELRKGCSSLCFICFDIPVDKESLLVDMIIEMVTCGT